MNLLEVRNLSVRIENRTILENLNFELGAGERLVILGPNAAGKTVLLKTLLNLFRYSGEIKWAPAVRVGYVPQKIDPERHLPLTYRDLFNAKRKILKLTVARIEEISDSVGLTRRELETPVGHLSGGQFQRGLVGFGLIGDPNVLLLDEPTASIDEPGEEHIYNLIHRLQDRYSLAVIAVSHDLSFIYRYATKVLCLNKQGLCVGAPQDVLAPEVLAKLYGEPVSYYHHDHTTQPAEH
ncbi:MAG TPA: metal ABC transporter ATP-binding protein [Blastocatellia bacterium]|nr:metal ABC transporter ATP-binding protein [Blastocatellia bacterium]